jgi:hypothetical protein
MLVLTLALALFLDLFVNAYVPASPTNSSQAAIAGGLNVTDISKLNLQWYFNGFVLFPALFFLGSLVNMFPQFVLGACVIPISGQ